MNLTLSNLKGGVRLLAAAALLLPINVRGDDFYEQTFSGAKPGNFLIGNEHDVKPDESCYRNIAGGSWFIGKVGTNEKALCPTRGANNEACRYRIGFPTIDVKEGALVAWEAQSMLRGFPESYAVEVRHEGSDRWERIMTVDEERHVPTVRSVSLADFVGDRLEVSFLSLTNPGKGFMLAIDNVTIGVNPHDRISVDVETPVYQSGFARVAGSIRNDGADAAWTGIELWALGEKATFIDLTNGDVFPPTFGEPMPFDFKLNIDNGSFEWALYAILADGSSRLLADGIITISDAPRTMLIDHFTGNWCNNCTQENLNAFNYEAIYGDGIVVTEAHCGSDPMVNPDFADFASEYIFSVPQFMANHDVSTVNSAPNYAENFKMAFYEPAIAMIEVSGTYDNGSVNISSRFMFTGETDNSDDRYAIGYQLLADIYRPDDPTYFQRNGATNARAREYYYLPELIKPELVKYFNVIVESSTGVKGIAKSVPASLRAEKWYENSHSLAIPVDNLGDPIKVLAMIIDRSTGKIVNCAVAPVATPGAVEVTDVRSEIVDENVYDLFGRRVNPQILNAGIYLRGGRKFIVR